MPCGLPLAVHRHASIAGVMLTRRGAFLWLLGTSAIHGRGRGVQPEPHGSLQKVAFPAVHSHQESSLYVPGDL